MTSPPRRYKFVEVAPVTAESLEDAVNAGVAEGWQLEGIRFVMTESSRRPAMAFVSFVTADAPAAGPVAAPAEA